MLASGFFRAVRDLPPGTLGDLTGGLPFVVVSPHPDDETLGTGGLIAAAQASGERAHVVLVTDGSGSHPHSQRYPREELADLRRRELELAATCLGLPPERVTALGLPDTKAPSQGPGFDAAVTRIAEVVRRTGARTVFVTWQHDPHCDHGAAALMAQSLRVADPALRLWAYPIWGWHLEAGADVDAPPPGGFRFEISPWHAAKSQAIAAHASQMTDLIDDDPGGFRFTPRTLEPFLGPFEYFLEVPT